MRRALPGINAELAAAVRAVNAAYLRIPAAYRPEVAGWTSIDLAVDAACGAGNRTRALIAIEEWRDCYVARFTQILASCPLDEREAA